MALHGQCPACHCLHQIDDGKIGRVLRCGCGVSLFVCSAREADVVPVFCQGCGEQYEAEAADAGEVMDCECGQSVIVPTAILRQPIVAAQASVSPPPPAAIEGTRRVDGGTIACPQCQTTYEVTGDDIGDEAECECGCEFVIRLSGSGTLVAIDTAAQTTPIVSNATSSAPSTGNHPQMLATGGDATEPKERKSSATGRDRSSRRTKSKAGAWITIGGIGSVLLVSIVMFLLRDDGETKDSSGQDESQVVAGGGAGAVEAQSTGIDIENIELATLAGDAASLTVSDSAIASQPDLDAQGADRSEYRIPPAPRYALPKLAAARPWIPTIPAASTRKTLKMLTDESFDAYQETLQLQKDSQESGQEETILAYRKKLGETIGLLEQTHELAIANRDPQQIYPIRYQLAYLHFTAGHLAEAGILAAAVARWGSIDEDSTKEAAMIALAAMQEANATGWLSVESVGELDQMMSVAKLIARRWPDEPKLDQIWMNLGQSYEIYNQPQQAAAAYLRVAAEFDDYPLAQYSAGNALWIAALRSGDGSGQSIDSDLRQRAGKVLAEFDASIAPSEANDEAALLLQVKARLALAQIAISEDNPDEVLRVLGEKEPVVIDSIHLAGSTSQTEEGPQQVVVDEKLARQLFDVLYAAQQQLGDTLACQATLEKRAQVFGTNDDEIAAKTLSLVSASIRQLRAKAQVSEDEVDQLQDLIDGVQNGDSEFSPENLMWIGQSWSQIGDRASSPALDRRCQIQAADLFKQAMEHSDFPTASLESARLRLVELLRKSGDLAAALEIIEQVLSQTPNAIALQIDAAQTLQQIAQETDEVEKFAAAADGPGDGSPIWGWAKLTSTLHNLRYSESGTEEHAESLLRCRYQLAACQIEIARRTADVAERESILAKVRRGLRSTIATMDQTNEPWFERFQRLQEQLDP